MHAHKSDTTVTCSPGPEEAAQTVHEVLCTLLRDLRFHIDKEFAQYMLGRKSCFACQEGNCEIQS
eukprot:1161276-Pelagomonas_calceolata.AAC.1